VESFLTARSQENREDRKERPEILFSLAIFVFAILRSGFGLKLPNSRRPAGYECPMTLVICTRSSGVNPYELESGANARGVPHDGDGGHGLSGESEIDATVSPT